MWHAGATKAKKKKPLKIKVGKTTGSRVVFNEEGQALQPLAQLALPDSTGCAAPLPDIPACLQLSALLLCTASHSTLALALAGAAHQVLRILCMQWQVAFASAMSMEKLCTALHAVVILLSAGAPNPLRHMLCMRRQGACKSEVSVKIMML